jgi:hypothetical protein
MFDRAAGIVHALVKGRVFWLGASLGELVTVQSFENGTISKFPRAIVWEAFRVYAHPAAHWGWDIYFPNGSRCYLNLDDDELVDGFGIERPCRGVFDLIYSVLSKVPAIMIVSSDGFSCVADEKVIEGLPAWLLSALPTTPVIVSSGSDIGAFFVSPGEMNAG